MFLDVLQMDHQNLPFVFILHRKRGVIDTKKSSTKLDDFFVAVIASVVAYYTYSISCGNLAVNLLCYGLQLIFRADHEFPERKRPYRIAV